MQQRRWIRAVVLVMLLSACAPNLRTPDGFPEPPWTAIVELPTVQPATPTARPIARPIFADDMDQARTFFLLVKVAMTAGDSAMVAERVLFPIQVMLNGQATTIQTPAEFEQNYNRIVDEPFRTALLGANVDGMMLAPDGVRAADGALWFGQFCADAACSDGQFLITQINK